MSGRFVVVVRSSLSNDATFQVVLNRRVSSGGIHAALRHEALGDNQVLSSEARQVFERLLTKQDTFGVRKITFGEDFLAPYIVSTQWPHLARYITVLVNALAEAYQSQPTLYVVQEGLGEAVASAVRQAFPGAKFVTDTELTRLFAPKPHA